MIWSSELLLARGNFTGVTATTEKELLIVGQMPGSNRFYHGCIWQLDIKTSRLRLVATLPLAWLRNATLTKEDRQLVVAVGGLVGKFGLGCILAVRVDRLVQVRLRLALLGAIALGAFRMLCALNLTSGLAANLRLLAASLKAGKFEPLLSWPTQVAAKADGTIYLAQSTQLSVVNLNGRVSKTRTLQDGFLNLVDVSAVADGSLLLCEMHLFDPVLHERWASGLGAVWRYTPGTASMALILGGLADPSFAAELHNGAFIAVISRAPKSNIHHLTLLEAKTKAVLGRQEVAAFCACKVNEETIALCQPGCVSLLELRSSSLSFPPM